MTETYTEPAWCAEERRRASATECDHCGAPGSVYCGGCPAGSNVLDQADAWTFDALADGSRTLDISRLWCRDCGRTGARTLMFGERGLEVVLFDCGHWWGIA